jgi:glycosyltransferase involved in cell wall biosynthesis
MPVLRRVLFLAYYFPPSGGAGVQRSLKLSRYMGNHGYEPVVVTTPEVANTRWTPLDSSLSAEIPAGMEVLRIDGSHPADREGWRARAERWCRLSPPWAAWWRDGAISVGSRVSSVDLVYASMSPWESGEAAEAISQSLDVPWVADLRDPWALDEMSIYPTAIHKRLEQSRMRRTLESASAIVMNTREAAAALRRELPGLAHILVTSIPNGFDSQDFARPSLRRSDKFRIVHTGYLHTDLGRRHRRNGPMRKVLGGATSTIDILPRSHIFLLQAVDRLLRNDPELSTILEVHLAGLLSEADREALRQHTRHPEIVRLHGYLPHDETVALVQSAGLLFLPMHDLAAGARARIVPGKTYEYLGSGRPVLAAVPDGDARDLLIEAGATVCRPRDVECLERALVTNVDRFRKGLDPLCTNARVAARYEHQVLAREISSVFDEVLAGSATADASWEERAASSR